MTDDIVWIVNLGGVCTDYHGSVVIFFGESDELVEYGRLTRADVVEHILTDADRNLLRASARTWMTTKEYATQWRASLLCEVEYARDCMNDWRSRLIEAETFHAQALIRLQEFDASAAGDKQ